ncbi:MAG: hypothetical protein K6B14_07885 [Lachnospiraceae bacterium]|nr:hypothetical protein [Lachnospiraceae bacterium]
MKKPREKLLTGNYIWIVVILLVIVAIYAAARLMQVDIPQDQKRISVVLENSGSERWSQYLNGIDQAASDRNVEVSTVMTTYFSREGERDDLVTSEYMSGANAVITKTEPDASQVADTLMEEITDEFDGGISGRSVALLKGSSFDTFTNEVAELLSARIEEAGGEILWQKNAPCNVSGLLKKSIRTDIIVALDDDLLCQAAAYLVTKKNDRRHLVGIGCSSNSVYYLDRGVITAMLVPDDFTLGYESLLAACDGENFSKLVPSVKLIYPDEVYQEENEKLLFP